METEISFFPSSWSSTWQSQCGVDFGQVGPQEKKRIIIAFCTKSFRLNWSPSQPLRWPSSFKGPSVVHSLRVVQLGQRSSHQKLFTTRSGSSHIIITSMYSVTFITGFFVEFLGCFYIIFSSPMETENTISMTEILSATTSIMISIMKMAWQIMKIWNPRSKDAKWMT